jgi:hypothetical protein
LDAKAVKKLNKQKTSLESNRLHVYHQYIVNVLKTDRSAREVKNVVLDTEGKLRNRLSGRLFTISDTEHNPACKVGIQSRNVDTSRTITDATVCHSVYTWPRANPKLWDEVLAR